MNDEKLKACWRELLSRLQEFCAEVQPIYRLNNWLLYPMSSNTFKIPNEKELHEIAYSLAWDAYQSAPNGVSSARLCVRFYKDNLGAWVGSIALQPVEVRTKGY